MLLHVIRRGSSIKLSTNSSFCQSVYFYSSKRDEERRKNMKWLREEQPEEHRYNRAMRVIKDDLKKVKRNVFFWKDFTKEPEEESEWSKDPITHTKHVDIVVIGGGAIGSSVAFWMKERAKDGLSVAVVEKDPTYKAASSVLSAGGLRQQFSLEENIEMSLFGAEFIQNAQFYLGIDGEPPVDIQFHPHGYLFLASEKGAEQLSENSKLQNSMGAKNIILTAKQLKNRFPWLNTEGIAAGCLGLEKEGWFDPWSLLCALKKKAISMNVDYVHGEVVGFKYKECGNVMVGSGGGTDRQKLNSVVVKNPNGERLHIQFALCIVAAGAFSREIAEMADIGIGPGALSIPLPVEPRKRYVYCYHCPDGPGLDTPLVIDPSGAYFRREGLGGNYIAGRSPEFEDEPNIDNLDVDESFFDEHVWPKIAHRVKAFEDLKVKSSWAGFYEFNTFDENGIVGNHPHHLNLVFATGFSGHGIQQAPAVGRAVAEWVIDSDFSSIDLNRLSFDRFIALEPLKEVNIV